MSNSAMGENEKCVCCGGDTGVLCSTPISKRKHYIEGCGQLCDDCYYDLYIHKSEDESLITLEEINELIRMCKNSSEPQYR